MTSEPSRVPRRQLQSLVEQSSIPQPALAGFAAALAAREDDLPLAIVESSAARIIYAVRRDHLSDVAVAVQGFDSLRDAIDRDELSTVGVFVATHLGINYIGFVNSDRSAIVGWVAVPDSTSGR